MTTNASSLVEQKDSVVARRDAAKSLADHALATARQKAAAHLLAAKSRPPPREQQRRGQGRVANESDGGRRGLLERAQAARAGAANARPALLASAARARQRAQERMHHGAPHADRDSSRASPEQTRRVRAVVGLLIAALLIALLWQSCGVDDGAATAVATSTASCATCPEPSLCVDPVRVKRPPAVPGKAGRVRATARESLEVKAPAPPAWLETFRRQVMGRSPVLSACFRGVDAPVGVWWSTRLSPSTGTATDSVFEPVLGQGALNGSQVSCLRRGLEGVPFALLLSSSTTSSTENAVSPRGVRAPSDVAASDAPVRLRLLLEF
jgi:hypothetical protein